MRRLPFLAVTLVLGLAAMPAMSATVVATDTPDVALAPGTAADNVFNLNDFFAGADSYSAEGASVATDGSVSIPGSTTAGMSVVKFTGGDVSVESVVQVSDFIIGNGPGIQDNNRIAGMDGGNLFLNGIAPGGSVSSMKALTNLPSGGAPGTPGGQTGVAMLIATVGEVTVTTADGLIQRKSALVEGSGLTPTLNPDGSYTLAADNSFNSAVVVTLGASAGASADAVHLVAAPEVALDLSSAGTFLPPFPAGTNPLGSASFGAGGIAINVAAGQGILLIAAAPVATGEYAVISLDYQTNSTDVNIAAIAFDGDIGLAPANVNYSNPKGANLEANKVKNLAVSIKSMAGSVLPAVQVFNGGNAAASVTISKMSVIMARPLVDYALNVNAKAAAPALTDAGWTADILGAGASGPVVDGGVVKLNGKGGIANMAATVSLGVGEVAAQIMAKRVGDADAGSALALVMTDGGANEIETFVPGSVLPTDMTKVICAGTLSAPSTVFLVIQAAGVDVEVSDLAVRIITDADSLFDYSLLGL
jgi:hypothetical protein